MKVSPYLIISGSGKIRVTKTLPYLEANEISFQLHLELPDALFSKPRIEASVVVPDDAVKPAVIDAQVASDVAQELRKKTGLEVVVTIDGGQEENTIQVD